MHYVPLVIAGLVSGLGWLLYRAAFLVAAIRADKHDLPAIIRAMKRMPLPRDGEDSDDGQGPPSLPTS